MLYNELKKLYYANMNVQFKLVFHTSLLNFPKDMLNCIAGEIPYQWIFPANVFYELELLKKSKLFGGKAEYVLALAKNKKAFQQNGKPVVNKFQHIVVHHIDSRQRQDGPQNTNQNSLDHKRSTNEEIRCTDIFHDINFFLPDRNTDGNRVIDQEHGHQDKNDDDAGRNVRYQRIYAGQRIRRKSRLVHRPNLGNGFQIGDQIRLVLHIIHENLIARTVFQRVVTLREAVRIFFRNEILLIILPGFFRRGEFHPRHIVPRLDLRADFLHPFLRRSLLKEDGNGHPRVRGMDDILEVQNHGIKKPQNKEAGADRRNGRQRKPLIPEDVDNALF